MINKNAPAPALDAPIPGQGMTAPLGDRPWQKPARFTTPEQALAFYLDRITQEQQVDQMLDILELGVPVDTLVDTLQLGGVMEGLHSVDVGMIIAPALIEAVTQIADKAGVKHTTEGQEQNPEAASDSEVALNLQRLKEKKEKGVAVKEPMVEKEDEEVPEEKPTGLMARRS
tara:strand:- start:1539 stop:2054 length:516 start_codon:yes stop_codon:yes gene_type:complete